ncbi:TFIIH basal transcription factor complex TTD-A subunit [Pancytospora philotis]|nr:TFIIH basal transcription factor complex TTD-A subunit [Pancytospora philotis]
MVRCIKGALVQTEPSIHEVIVKLSKADNFIIEDIDDSAIFITQKAAATIKEQVQRVMNP